MKFKIFFRTTGQFSTKISTKHPWVKGIQICLNEGLLPFPMGDYNKIAKIHWRKFKILFFRPSGLISTKPGTKYLWMKGIIRKGRWLQNSKNTLMKFKIFFRTTGPFSTKLSTQHPWVKGIQICSNEGLLPFPMGDYNKVAKIHWRNFKILFFRPSGPISIKLGTKHP